jgi:hypothetical protein
MKLCCPCVAILIVVGVAHAGVAAPPLTELSPVRMGDRVRVRKGKWVGGRLVIGELVALDEKGMEIKRERYVMPLRLEWAEVDTLDVSRGWDFRPGIMGAGIGAVVFASAANLAVGLGNLDCESRCPTTGDHAKGLALGAAVGVVVGGLVGSVFADDRWARARTRSPVAALTVAPQRGGARVALTLRF